MRLVTDVFAFCTEHVPRWNTISVSGYHIREAGATAAQELAFTLRDGIEYVQYGIDAGLDVDAFAPRISFFFNSHSDFFEEIAKFRAARRIWARVMRDRFKAQSPRSWQLRFHAQTAGVSLTAQQPYNNVVRTALQAMAAVLGGTQSLHTNALDEALALPTEEAATLALRTQQIIAHETGRDRPDRSARWVVLPRVADRAARERGAGLLRHHRSHGRHGRRHRARLPAARDCRERVPRAAGRRIEGTGHRRRERLRRDRGPKASARSTSTRRPASVSWPGSRQLRARRDAAEVRRTLAALQAGARSGSNTMPLLLDAARAYATVGEMCDSLREVWGEYVETPIV